MSNRTILTTLDSQATSDGDGVKIKRIVANGNMGLLDPFLMLDEIAADDSADYIGGFPPHPHRGFETITYMLDGAFTHRDHMGNEGHLRAGGVQWMTTGKGIIHSEMPEQDEGRLHGFQIWLNLPAKDKMQDPRYQEFEPDAIPEIDLEGKGLARIISGELKGVRGPITNVATDPTYFDIRLSAGQSLDIPIPTSYQTLVYVYKGSIAVAEQTLIAQQLAQLSKGSSVHIQAKEDSGFLFLAGSPIREPIVNYGPFVMNTRKEIKQAIDDYNSGRFTN
jgi:redox-sensitive bicupin YhaK (pirin superfamily)